MACFGVVCCLLYVAVVCRLLCWFAVVVVVDCIGLMSLFDVGLLYVPFDAVRGWLLLGVRWDCLLCAECVRRCLL